MTGDGQRVWFSLQCVVVQFCHATSVCVCVCVVVSDVITVSSSAV